MSKKDHIVRLSHFENSAAFTLPALVDEIRKICQQELHSFLCQMFESADDKLFDMAESGYDRAKFDALRLLRLKKDSLLKDFSLGLDEHFLQKLSKSPNEEGETNQSLSALSFENIALVENAELEEEIALDAMVSKTRQRNVQELEKIRFRLDAVVSGRRITANHNPLEPAVICEVFKQSLSSLDLDIETLLVIYKLFERGVCARLETLYQRINQFFVEHGVLPDLQVVAPQGYRNPNASEVNTPQDLDDQNEILIPDEGLGREPQSRNSADQYDTQHSLSSEGQVVALLRELVAEKRNIRPARGEVNVASLSPDGSGTPKVLNNEQLLNVLSGIQRQILHQDIDIVPSDMQAIKSAISQQVGGTQAEDVRFSPFSEDMIDIVSMLFDFILDDKSVAAEIKSLLARLQIPMLKVGMIDRQFFSNKKHPARQLLNELAYAGISWDAKDPSATTMLQAIERIVERICDEFVDDISLFDKMLKEFIAFKNNLEKKASILEKRTREAEEGKARAESARGKVNQVLNEICRGREVPTIVRQIFKQVWAHVMFLEALKNDPQSWEKVTRFARALVWSVQVRSDQASLNKLTKLLPQLIKSLKQGFDIISLSHIEASRLLDQLESKHLEVIERSREKIQEPDEIIRLKPGSFLDESDATLESEKEAEAEPVADSVDIEEVGFSPQQTGEVENLTEVKAQLLPESLVAIEQLHAGSWYELKLGEEFQRCKLAARIVSTGRYIFVNRSGIKVAEFLAEQLALEYQLGHLKLLDDDALFDRALESVIANLRELKAAAQ